jgi:hypothetical protein
VAAENPPDRIEAVNKALATWRQGDCVLGEQWFALRFDPKHPLSFSAQTAATEGGDLAEEQVLGFVVVTQTCDIVRSCSERPFVEVCPLVEVDDSKLQEITRGRRPAYAFMPELANQRLVADLDRTMTVEKPVVAKWLRTPGWSSDDEARAFAQALARKRVRFAFPDDFTELAKKLQRRLVDKHEKNTEEGRGLRALREIRVQAIPSWDANSIELLFWFIRDDDDANFEGKNWAELLEEWLKLLPKSGRYVKIDGQVVTMNELTGADYVGSDPLDLDHLSSRSDAK